MGRILVTGGAGFIGGFVSRALAAARHDVDIVDNFRRGKRDRFLQELLASPHVRLHDRDLASPDALDDLGTGYTHVLHFAAALGVQNVIERPYETLHDNVWLLDTVVRFAQRQRGLERLLFPSTSEVYVGSIERGTAPIPTPESTPLVLPDLGQPRSSYMLSKICGEALVRHAGVPFTIVRPHNVYGPRMGLSHVVPQLLERAHRTPEGGDLEVFSVDHTRTFCFIDDAVEMIVRATTSPRCDGAVLNVGKESPEVRIGDLAQIVLATVAKKLRIVAKPPTPGSPARRCPDMRLTTELTGYAASMPLEDGGLGTYRGYRDEIFSGTEKEVAI
jgi:nucleoside-diphosphate-sugar epimerase